MPWGLRTRTDCAAGTATPPDVGWHREDLLSVAVLGRPPIAEPGIRIRCRTGCRRPLRLHESSTTESPHAQLLALPDGKAPGCTPVGARWIACTPLQDHPH